MSKIYLYFCAQGTFKLLNYGYNPKCLYVEELVQMSNVRYKNRCKVKAKDIVSSRIGDLLLQDRETIRGKSEKETHNFSYDAIFTFEIPFLCNESEVPFGGGYFIADNGMAEVTQLIGRFKNELERSEWLEKTFKTKKDNTI